MSRVETRKRKNDSKHRAINALKKRERTKTALIEAAFSLLGHERGNLIKIEDVCKAANMSRGTFYNYFASIDDVFDALAYELSHDYNVAVTAILDELPTAADRVGFAIRYYLERAVEDPHWGWAMVHISAHGPFLGTDTYKHAMATLNFGIDQGEFLISDPEACLDLQLGTTVAAIITQLRNEPKPGYSATICRLVLQGMGVKASAVDEIISKPLIRLNMTRWNP